MAEEPLRIVMHRPTFDRACGSGPRFVVFGPFLEMRRGKLLLVSHAEALPSQLLPPPIKAIVEPVSQQPTPALRLADCARERGFAGAPQFEADVS